MSVLRKFTSNAEHFRRDRSGNFAIMAVVAAPVLFCAGGIAINIGQMYNARAAMQAAVDSAVTSTTRDITLGVIPVNDAEKSIRNFIDANGNGGLSEGDRIVLAQPDINRSARTVSATISVDLTMVFPIFGMPRTQHIEVNAAASYADRPVEVAMMLDLTGSMNSRGTPLADGSRQTKLQNLQVAAKDAVKDLLSRNQPGNTPRVKVALIPYSTGVNTGALADANYIESPLIPVAPIGLDTPNTPPVRAIRQVLASLRPLTDSCTTERKRDTGSGATAIDLSDDEPGLAMVNRDDRIDDRLAPGETACPTTPVQPLTADQSRLLSAIDSFRGGGYTAGHIGIQWTRYMLSPKWGKYLKSRGLPDAAPARFGSSATSVRKVAVLMTDGEFNAAYAGVGPREQPAGGQGVRSQAYAQAHCSAMKADMEVFTIGFMLDNAAAKQTMAACASRDTGGVQHYFEASNAAELAAAFDAITRNLEVIRLTN